jgi:hypothetical protein
MDSKFQLISLANYLQSVFLPCRKRMRWEPVGPGRPGGLDADSYRQRGFERLEEQIQFQQEEIPRKLARFAVWGSYFWLHLGVELGVFPRDEAFHVSETQFDHPDHSGEPEFGYTPGALRNLYASASKYPIGFPATQYSSLSVKPAFQAAFQSILQLEACIERNALARNFTGAISFTSDQVWESIFFEPASQGINFPKVTISFEKLDLAYEDETEEMDLTIEKVVVGFYMTLEHMAHLQQLFLDLRGVPGVSKDEQLVFERRIREICNWRLNFLNPKVKERFYSLVEPAMERVRSMALKSSEISGSIQSVRQHDGEFLKVLKQLGDPWQNLVIGNLSSVTGA